MIFGRTRATIRQFCITKRDRNLAEAEENQRQPVLISLAGDQDFRGAQGRNLAQLGGFPTKLPGKSAPFLTPACDGNPIAFFAFAPYALGVEMREVEILFGKCIREAIFIQSPEPRAQSPEPRAQSPEPRALAARFCISIARLSDHTVVFPRRLRAIAAILILPAAFLSIAGSAAAQAVDPVEAGSLVIKPEAPLNSSLIDPAAGFAYFGTYGGEILKIRLSDFTKTDALDTVPDGGDTFHAAAIDTAAGFAYFGTNTVPGKIIKLRLSDFTKVAELTLNAGENQMRTAVIDPAAGFAYFAGSASALQPGYVVKIRLSDFTRVGALTFNAGENGVRSSVIDPSGGFAYFGTSTSPGIVVKVRLSDFTRDSALTLAAGENILTAAAIDPGGDRAYFATDTSPSRVVEVRLSDLTRQAALTLSAGESFARSALVDAAAGFGYFGVWGGALVKVRLSDMVRLGAVAAAPSALNLNTGVLDTAGGFAYFGTDEGASATSARLVKVDLGGFAVAETRTLRAGHSPTSAVIDDSAGFAYFGSGPVSPSAVKVRLQDFALVDGIDLTEGSDFTTGLLDKGAGFLYLAGKAAPSKLTKIWLSDFKQVDSLALSLDGALAGVLDPDAGVAYFAVDDCGAGVERVRLSDFTKLSAISFGDCLATVDTIRSAVIDRAGGFAYFGSETSDGMGRVFKMRLSDAANVGELALNAGENDLTAAAIDAAAGFAYFGTDTTPGQVIKVRLSDLSRAGALTLAAGEGPLQGAFIDANNGFLHLLAGSSRLVRVRLSDFTRVDSLALSAADWEGGALDPANGFVYLAAPFNSKVLKVQVFAPQTIGGGGGSITITPAPGPVTVQIPPQAFSEPVAVTVQVPASFPEAASPAGQLQGAGVGVEVTLDKSVQPAREVTISVSYRDEDAAGLDEGRLILARHDTARNVWVPLVSAPDPANNMVVGRTNHFSIFQVMQAAPSSTVDTAKAFPNPLRPAKGHTSMTFVNLPANSRLRIYTLLGELVKDLTADAAGMASWDGTNSSGAKAASGVYFVFAQGAGEKRTFKVAIQR